MTDHDRRRVSPECHTGDLGPSPLTVTQARWLLAFWAVLQLAGVALAVGIVARYFDSF